MKGAKFDIPIISVGNLSTGGTGKSPHVEYLVKLLSKEYNMATLSRGYGRSKSGFHLVQANSTVKDCGDEPLQFKHKFPNATIAVHKDRVNGIIELLRYKPQIDCVILDDAFQHRSIVPGFSILLTEYSRPYYKDWMLPTGNLREWAIGRSRATTILVTKCPENLSKADRALVLKKINPAIEQTVYFSSFRYGRVVPLNKGNLYDSIAQLRDFEILLITGIANPQPIIDKLNSEELNFKHIRFPDHHRFSSKDIKKIRKLFDTFDDKKLILSTEKDAQRLKALKETTDLPINYVEIEVFLLDDGVKFNNEIEDYVRQHKTDSTIPEESDQFRT